MTNTVTIVSMFTRVSHRRYLLILAIVFALEWALLAIAPYDRADWALENALVAVFVLVLAATHRVFPLSRISYTLIFVFLLLHEIGAHYTYAKVPYDEGFVNLFGFSLNDALGFERNHFDRALHFSYGLLLAYPVREVFIRLYDKGLVYRGRYITHWCPACRTALPAIAPAMGWKAGRLASGPLSPYDAPYR